MRSLLRMPALPAFLLVSACAAGPGVVAAPAPAPVQAVAVTGPAMAAPEAALPVQFLRGEFRQGELIVGRVPPGSRVKLGDRALRVAGDGTFVFGLDRDADPEIAIDVVLPDGKPWRETRPVAARQYNIQRVTGIAERIMNPSADDQKRIDEENAQVGRARHRDDDRLDFLQAFIWPAAGPVTGVFGSQRYYNGVPKRPHFGVDVGVPVGTPVVAPAPGVVTLAHPDMFYSGGTLIIDHGYGVSSTLMHLSEVLVKTGDVVARGQLVAKSGASGRASGPHLDWRMNWFGVRIDAQRLVPPMPSGDAAAP
ncbi:MAG: M23 family metallopeptidase [Pseudomonadota bacterium]